MESYHCKAYSDLFYRELLESARLQVGAALCACICMYLYIYLNLKAQNNREKKGCSDGRRGKCAMFPFCLSSMESKLKAQGPEETLHS